MTSDPAAVVLLCGMAGAGKTTYAERLAASGHVRLSIDEELWSRFGRYGVDYPVVDYGRLSDVVERDLRRRLLGLVTQRRAVVLDYGFWLRTTRDRYKRLIAAAGGRWDLVYLKVPEAELRRRLEARADRFDANAAFPIVGDRFTTLLSNFDEPDGEGERVVEAVDGVSIPQT